MKTRIWTGLITVYVVWGITYLGIRYAIETMPPLIMAGSRFFLGGILFYAFSRIKGASPPTRKEWRAAGVVGILIIAGGTGSLTWAEQRVASGVASLIIATVPLWMLIIDMLLSRSIKFNLFNIIGVLIGFSGILVLIGPAITDLNSNYIDPVGVVVLLLAAISIASGSIYNRGASLPTSLRQGIGMEMMVGAGVLLLVGTMVGELESFNIGNVSARSWTAYFYLLIFGSIIGYGIYIWLLRVAPTPLVSTYAFMNPLVALLVGTLVGHEPLTTRIILSGLVIISSVILINIGGSISSKPRIPGA
jgi:drug/metabolite transporter (DMT)-like permease